MSISNTSSDENRKQKTHNFCMSIWMAFQLLYLKWQIKSKSFTIIFIFRQFYVEKWSSYPLSRENFNNSRKIGSNVMGANKCSKDM